ncbi:MAG: branched-chain amino acid ABC transporter permease [Anaerolineae bacterium CG_4_9_14_3_um_filter_57_17]|nr:AzlC family ABC transporter permease [bacterium]NCT21227.1 AzlC family ABC transporter permease [bacterium]OIO84255.1 MAG: branched-chain amino acid ABC transporter permease [Anaerolineae bacterium CG2_30_57_67]PJB68603.1 MAG: branched-chain amino acid ABC transporter permease [Anaerolineae bacterium CG_4_9_14_3_um_filter_57_17]
MNESAGSQFWGGVRDELPILLGVIPFGMIYGILALSAGLPALEAQAMSAIVFAGASQFMLVELVKAGTPVFVIVLTTFVINLRHALYSATVAPYLQTLPLCWKGALAYLLTDEAFAVGVLNYQRRGVTAYAHWYFFGAGLALWSAWQISTAAGIFLGAQIPAVWGLDFTLPLTFLALVVPALKDRAGVATALIASLAALALIGLPFKLGLISATLIAIGAGLLAEKKATT